MCIIILQNLVVSSLNRGVNMQLHLFCMFVFKYFIGVVMVYKILTNVFLAPKLSDLIIQMQCNKFVFCTAFF